MEIKLSEQNIDSLNEYLEQSNCPTCLAGHDFCNYCVIQEIIEHLKILKKTIRENHLRKE